MELDKAKKREQSLDYLTKGIEKLKLDMNNSRLFSQQTSKDLEECRIIIKNMGKQQNFKELKELFTKTIDIFSDDVTNLDKKQLYQNNKVQKEALLIIKYNEKQKSISKNEANELQHMINSHFDKYNLKNVYLLFISICFLLVGFFLWQFKKKKINRFQLIQEKINNNLKNPKN